MASAVVLSYLTTIVVALAFASGREALWEAVKLLPGRTPLAAPSEAK
jgi:PST family polysaccharide transporter